MRRSKLHIVHDISSCLAQLYKTINMVLCTGTVLSCTAEYAKAKKDLGFFPSGHLSALNDCQECKYVSNSFATHFIFQFP